MTSKVKPFNALKCEKHGRARCAECAYKWRKDKEKEKRERERKAKAKRDRSLSREWICRCGKLNLISHKTCEQCQRDRPTYRCNKPQEPLTAIGGKRIKRLRMRGGEREKWLEQRIANLGRTSIIILKTKFEGPKPKWGDPYARPSKF